MLLRASLEVALGRTPRSEGSVVLGRLERSIERGIELRRSFSERGELPLRLSFPRGVVFRTGGSLRVGGDVRSLCFLAASAPGMIWREGWADSRGSGRLWDGVLRLSASPDRLVPGVVRFEPAFGTSDERGTLPPLFVERSPLREAFAFRC